MSTDSITSFFFGYGPGSLSLAAIAMGGEEITIESSLLKTLLELGILGLHEYTELKSVNYSGFSIEDTR